MAAVFWQRDNTSFSMKTDTTPAEAGADNSAWTLSVADTLTYFATDPKLGLKSQDASKRLLHYGHNQLRAARSRHIGSIIFDQFKGVVILLLSAAGTLAILFSDYLEGLAIFAVIAINATIGFLTEWRATRSMEALKKLGHVDTVVLRDGVSKKISAESLVPGDIVIFDGGDMVTADVRLIEAARLEADESTLTGESLPVSKQTDVLLPDTLVMDRINMVFKGTAITQGSGKGVVVGTGLDTELGRISKLVTEAEAPRTPLEKRLNSLGERLAVAVIVIAVFVAIAGILTGRETFLAIEVAVALAVAAIPEGLPIVATIALARGMWRMAQRNALIAKLSAVETLGATSVILTDKTGTLTENRMTATAIHLADADITIDSVGLEKPGHFRANNTDLDGATSAVLEYLLSAAALCSNASLNVSSEGEISPVGDPTEIALLVAAAQRGIKRDELQERMPEIGEEAFDPNRKLMATLHTRGSNFLIAVKGAPEAVIPLCNEVRTTCGNSTLTTREKDKWLAGAQELGQRGLRTLAIASKVTAKRGEEAYGNLVLLGIVGLEDPPRAGVKDAVARCRSAGVSVVMVTGDHLATARNIAGELGIAKSTDEEHSFVNGADLDSLLEKERQEELLEARVFSRATPEQKLRLIALYQRKGYVVAMTGDGVNDAPALKQADIGIAMGIRGTAVAKEAAHMVLQDDEFSTIVESIAQGRAIYENIRKFIVYLLSCNISEVLVISLATIASAPLPLLPLQILFLNLVTDVFPALALGVGEGSPSLMKRKPRSADELVLTRSHWLRIGLHGTVMSLAVLGAMAIAILYLHFDADRAVTVSFCTLAFAQLWHVFNMRDNIGQVFNNEITRNAWIWAAVVTCVALILGAIYTPLPSAVLGLTDPGASGWLIILPMSLIPLVFAPLVRLVAR